MKILPVMFLTVGIIGSVNATSLLTAQKFPKTFQDLSFQDKITVLSEGFEPFETEYDKNGRCIRNCPYYGINIEDAIAHDNERTANAVARAKGIKSTKKSGTSGESVPRPPLLISETFPKNPLDAMPMIVTSPYGNRSVVGGTTRHQAIDLRAVIGTPVYATANGVVSRVTTQHSRNGRFGCGKYIEIKHDNGYKTQYCHLSEQLVSVNQQVTAGTMIGKTGNTGGINMAPHLHYAIYDLNGDPEPGPVDPAEFLLPGTWKCKPDVALREGCIKHLRNQHQS